MRAEWCLLPSDRRKVQFQNCDIDRGLEGSGTTILEGGSILKRQSTYRGMKTANGKEVTGKKYPSDYISSFSGVTVWNFY